ncbi:DUF86 domain-containing protein [Thiothrix unzii]|jgi:uncharacterized protein with HEPN domain|uniref:HepT-like ribonuclease domain-containing protein n=1 Tax=Thiothrix unzii TaxID=111769 RepID=UPI002A36E890|nr:DUF86 domain-containing protein [Thiothrix unzii]MDX9988536.1 DUF86 domain-containing protein [Thiothrix unzii]
MYDRELLIEKLQTLLAALRRIPRRFASITEPSDFYLTEDGEDKLDAICMILIAAGEELKNIDRKTEGKLFPQYPAVRWRGAMGMRDVLAHTYFHVDAEQLFNICKNDIPTMIATLETMLSDLQQAERN